MSYKHILKIGKTPLIFISLILLLGCEVPQGTQTVLEFDGPVTLSFNGDGADQEIVVTDQTILSLVNTFEDPGLFAGEVREKTYFYFKFSDQGYLEIYPSVDLDYASAKFNLDQSGVDDFANNSTYLLKKIGEAQYEVEPNQPITFKGNFIQAVVTSPGETNSSTLTKEKFQEGLDANPPGNQFVMKVKGDPMTATIKNINLPKEIDSGDGSTVPGGPSAAQGEATDTEGETKCSLSKTASSGSGANALTAFLGVLLIAYLGTRWRKSRVGVY